MINNESTTMPFRLVFSLNWTLTWQAGPNMGRSISFEKFVVLVLFGYFGFNMLRAHNKLRDRKIGTVFQTISVKTVQESKESPSNVNMIYYHSICLLR